MDQEKIYILFSDTGTVLSEAIKLHTKQPYNHASIALDAELRSVFSFGRRQPHNPFNGGFVKENMQYFPFSHARCALYSLSVTKEQKARVAKSIARFEMDREMYIYNFIGLFGILLKKEFRREHAFFCSQFVSTILQENGLAYFSKPVCFIKPDEIQALPALELEYEGDLQNYLTARPWDTQVPFHQPAQLV